MSLKNINFLPLPPYFIVERVCKRPDIDLMAAYSAEKPSNCKVNIETGGRGFVPQFLWVIV